MTRSMTGFGRASSEAGQYAVRVEVRSVNNRSLRITFRLPERIQGTETDLEKVVRNVISRGTVSVFMAFDDTTEEPAYVLDPTVVRYYRETLAALNKEFGLAGEPSIEAIAALPGAIVRNRPSEDLPEELTQAARSALEGALAEMVDGREREGAFIWKDILSRGRAIGSLLDRVEERIPGMMDDYRRRLSERLAKLLEGVNAPLDDAIVEREIALFADRADISEEVTRLRSHLAMMQQGSAEGDPFGRRLEFIAQEMFREANTMASKANDPRIVHHVLDIKSEIEKLREQALNVE